MQINKQITEGIKLAAYFGFLRRNGTLGTLAMLYKHGQLKPRHYGELLRRLKPVFDHAARHPEQLLFEYPRKPIEGDIAVGKLPVRKMPLSLPFKELVRHVCIIGASGCTKTTLLNILVRSCLQYKATTRKRFYFWLTDWVKAESSRTINLFKQYGEDIKILDVPNLYINLFQLPESVPHNIRIERVIELFKTTLALPDATTLGIRRILPPLFHEKGLPTFREFIDRVKEDENIPESIRTPLLSKLEGVANTIPHMIDVREGLDISDLSQQNLIWSLSGIANDIQTLIAGWARWGIFTDAVARRKYTSEPDLILVDDEAKRLFAEENFITSLTAVERSTGVAQLLANQDAQLARTVKANIGTKIMGMPGTRQDLDEWGNAMALTSQQKLWAINNLRPGRFIIKCAYGYMRPTPFAIPYLRLPRVDESKYMFRAPKPPRSETPATHNGLNLSPDEKILITSAHQHPDYYLSEHYKATDLLHRRGSRAKTSLLTKGVVKEHVVEGRKGRSPRLLEITPKGFKALGEQPPETNGRDGGFLHQCGKRIVSLHYRAAGFQTTIEHPLGEGKAIDILAEKDAERIAVEVEISASHVEENIEKLRGLPFNRVEIACFHTRTKKKVETRLGGRLGIQIRYIHEYKAELDLDSSNSPNLSHS